MTPRTRAPYTLIFPALLFGLLYAAPAPAQKRNTRPRRARPAQTRPQPSQSVASTPPAKPQDQQLYEQDKAVLDALSVDNRAAVRAGLEELSEALRLYAFGGYDESFLRQVELQNLLGKKTKLEQSVTKAYDALPASSLKNLIANAWGAYLYGNLAERLYRKYPGSGDKELLKIADRYKLQGVTAPDVGTYIFAHSAAALKLAMQIAERAGIMPEAIR